MLELLTVWKYTYDKRKPNDTSYQQKAQLLQQKPATEQWHSVTAEVGAIIEKRVQHKFRLS